MAQQSLFLRQPGTISWAAGIRPWATPFNGCYRLFLTPSSGAISWAAGIKPCATPFHGNYRLFLSDPCDETSPHGSRCRSPGGMTPEWRHPPLFAHRPSTRQVQRQQDADNTAECNSATCSLHPFHTRETQDTARCSLVWSCTHKPGQGAEACMCLVHVFDVICWAVVRVRGASRKPQQT